MSFGPYPRHRQVYRKEEEETAFQNEDLPIAQHCSLKNQFWVILTANNTKKTYYVSRRKNNFYKFSQILDSNLMEWVNKKDRTVLQEDS